MEKVDFKKQDKAWYTGKQGRIDHIDVPALPFLMIDGEGNPNGPRFEQNTAALYAISYALKFMSKKEFERDYVVPPLEGLWWADDPDAFKNKQKDQWRWTLMVRQPDWFTAEHIEVGRATAIKKNKAKKEANTDVETIEKVRFDCFAEGACVQTLHIGSYDDEGPTIKAMCEEYMPSQGLVRNGHHHEIYIGDPRKVEPAKLKTLLRQPVREG